MPSFNSNPKLYNANAKETTASASRSMPRKTALSIAPPANSDSLFGSLDRFLALGQVEVRGTQLSNRRKAGAASSVAKPAQHKPGPAPPPLFLFLLHHQFAILHFHISHKFRKLQAIVLLGKFFLQRGIHQRNRYVKITDLKLRGLESRISVF
jgi:hypothetical protein